SCQQARKQRRNHYRKQARGSRSRRVKDLNMGETQAHDAKELPLVAHLIELRHPLLRSVGVVLVLFALPFAWPDDHCAFDPEPLTSQLDNDILSTSPMYPFLVPMKLTFMVALFIAFPYVLHQAWAFISPGLYQNEIKVTAPILISSVVLFYA